MTVLAVFWLLMLAVAPAGAQQLPLQVPESEQFTKQGMYIVRMIEDPVVAYDGDIPGYPATKPAQGQKINPNSANVRKYVDFLAGRHDEALAAVGARGQKVYDYQYSFNGFAASLNPGQANKLARLPGVISVEQDTLFQVDTNRSATFLELDAEGGLWDATGGIADAGEGVVVGIIDTGIWPENPSFSDRTGTGPRGQTGKLDYQQIPGWNGKCTPGEEFPASDCNLKVIAAQWFNQGWGGDSNIKNLFPYEYVSARDADGHGTHTASTAAGNYGVQAVVDGADLGSISGMAPRARVAAYKVCWGRGGDGGCFGSDSVAAIDQAVADGVDVLNFSISGSTSNYLDAVEVAFLFAADAGVFVAASAGNSGPGAGTVAHMSPWLTTVAAGTKDDSYIGTVTLGSGVVIEGQSRTGDVGPAPLVYAGDAGDALCYPNTANDPDANTLDPTIVSGKIVVCDRGVIARTDKSLAVKQAGGIGVVLANTSPSSVNADLHYLPTVHVDDIDGKVIRDYARTVGATATLTGGRVELTEAPDVAAFSSRGPNQAGADLLKPDIMAPGVDILAAVSPAGYGGREWDFLSGTSMSSPHIAGIAALMKDAHPDWSPAMIKSALMTTASQTTNRGNPIDGDPFAYGAGQVTPNSAVEPGLVYDAGWEDYLGFLCGTGQLTASYCPEIAIDPSDLNYPSISIGELAGVQTVTRTVTNVGPSGTYSVSVEAPAGVDVTVSPETLDLDSGESATYEVTFTSTSAADLDEYAFGALTWSDGTRSVRSPLVVKPVQLAAPAEVSGVGTEGTLSFDVTFGYDGEYSASPRGLFAATQTGGTVIDDPANDINTALSTGEGITVHEIDVPAGAAYARFSLFDEYTDGADDLDLYVFGPDGNYVGGSGSGTSAEQVDLESPAAGTYSVVVHGWQTDGPDAKYTLFSWSIPSMPDGGSLTVTDAPTSATLGATESIEVSWSGLAAGAKYLGAVSHSDGAQVIGLTLVSVETE